MRIENKLLFRMIKKQLSAFISIALIISVATGFYITLKSIVRQYEIQSEKYYKDYSLADLTLYGGFNKHDVDKAGKVRGVVAVTGRINLDAKRNDTLIRVMSLPDDILVNKPFFYGGSLPEGGTECLISKKYADRHGLAIGDSISIKLSGRTYDFAIAGLVASCEYVYLSKNENVPFEDPYEFGLLYVNEEFFDTNGMADYNELLFILHGGSDREQIAGSIKSVLDRKMIVKQAFKDQQTSYKLYKSDLGEISSFAYVFPIVFFLIASMIIYVLQKRNIARERKQIGIQKALGRSDRRIIISYVKYSVLAAAAGTAGGSFISLAVGGNIMGMFRGFFEVPDLRFILYFPLCMITLLISLFVCILSNYFAVKGITGISPAEAMHAERPKLGKKILLERAIFIWKALSFNSRYSLKAALRSKGRFIAVALGMAATIALSLFSMGFMDSFEHIINNYYNKAVKYDLLVNIEPLPFEQDSEVTGINGIGEFEKALIVPVTLAGSKTKKDMPLLVTGSEFDLLDTKNPEGRDIDTKTGIVLPEYAAETLGVGIGDVINLKTFDGKIDIKVKISDLSVQSTGFYVYTSYDYAEQSLKFDDNVYNSLFIKTDTDSRKLSPEIEDTEGVISITSIEQDKKTLTSLMRTISMFTVILIGFALVLGVAVLYSIGVVNLTARSYEFNLLKVMGYSTGNIMLAYVKETILQLLVAIPIGIVFGHLVLLAIKGEFSTGSFVLSPYIYLSSYLYALAFLMAAVILVAMLAKRHIDKLDMVEGLKQREE